VIRENQEVFRQLAFWLGNPFLRGVVLQMIQNGHFQELMKPQRRLGEEDNVEGATAGQDDDRRRIWNDIRRGFSDGVNWVEDRANDFGDFANTLPVIRENQEVFRQLAFWLGNPFLRGVVLQMIQNGHFQELMKPQRRLGEEDNVEGATAGQDDDRRRIWNDIRRGFSDGVNWVEDRTNDFGDFANTLPVIRENQEVFRQLSFWLGNPFLRGVVLQMIQNGHFQELMKPQRRLGEEDYVEGATAVQDEDRRRIKMRDEWRDQLIWGKAPQ